MPSVFPAMQFTSLQFHFIAADGRPVRSAVPLHVLRGLFMSAVAAVQPGLASTIHDAGTLSEFSAQLNVDRENVFVTYNLFSKRLNEAMRDFILQRDDLRFNIGRMEALLVKVAVNRIHAGQFIDEAKPIEKAKVVFKTPTFFKSEGAVVLFPVPEIMFKHLAHSWNELIAEPGTTIDELALGTWVKEHARVSAYRLETSSVDIGDGNRSNTGFKGWATLAIKKDEAGGGFPAVMDRLLRFAEYCNVGGGRNTGLGAIRYSMLGFQRQPPQGTILPTTP
ncbi:MAG: CRISPR system precrRNA processing endoribonuclease RAMP protein Cas6 [Candidatus Sigynarchaeota archaeon]